MIKEKVIRSIFITTFTIFTLFVIYMLPERVNPNFLDPKINVEYVLSLETSEVYLLGPNNYLVKTKVMLDDKDLNTKIQGMIEYLTINASDRLPVGLKGIIPANTKLIKLEVKDNIAYLDFSKELLKVSAALEERMIEAICFSINSTPEIKGVIIKVEGEILTELPHSKKSIPEILTREYGINKVYNLTNRKKINKVVLYYVSRIDNNSYYVPVTKYVNDDREKIKIIIENLTSSYIYDNNLISYVSRNAQLVNYQIEDELMMLTFNNSIFESAKVLEEVTNMIAYSIFDNYNVERISLEIKGQEAKIIER